MTKEEIKKAFPIESKIFYNEKESFLYQQLAKVINHCSDGYMWFLNIEWEDKETRERCASVGLDPCNFSVVHGPAVQEPEPQSNHDDMIYNVITGKWSWF